MNGVGWGGATTLKTQTLLEPEHATTKPGPNRSGLGWVPI